MNRELLQKKIQALDNKVAEATAVLSHIQDSIAEARRPLQGQKLLTAMTDVHEQASKLYLNSALSKLPDVEPKLREAVELLNRLFDEVPAVVAEPEVLPSAG